MKKYILITIAVTVILLIGYFGFEKLSYRAQLISEEEIDTYKGTITIGTETWPGYLPLYVARDKGYFAEAGLNIEIKRYIALGELSRDYIAGKMQGRANLTLDAISEAYEGLDHKVVLAIDYSNGSDAIIALEGIKKISDIKGKRVGYEEGTLEEFFLAWTLREYGMELSDIVSVYGNPKETVMMLKDGQLDVAISHEPFLSDILKESSGIHILQSSADTPWLITDVLTFRTDFIDQYPETIQAIVLVYFKALDFWKENPEEANNILAKEFGEGETAESIAAQLDGVKLLDEKDNSLTFTFAAGLQSLYGNMRQVGKFIRKHRSEEEVKIDTDMLIDKSFIRNLKNTN